MLDTPVPTSVAASVPDERAVFFFAPLCGTCKLAEQMLAIVQEAPAAVPVVKLNINFAPVLRQRWKIASVPALVLLKDGRPVQTEYAMRSVTDLYELLRRDKR
ncbi:hypothetical protein VN24_14230 [Paenibacillus beijingensis]|uniref:Thioredoxin domain-containing protein n=1 Tax=Paenibacillus beijingensis TaxID=1126833 RepID=A0A0D5NRX2_9BACL|nr:hypothetical protein VN24_14230 [Paenibacillus beijingensis]